MCTQVPPRIFDKQLLKGVEVHGITVKVTRNRTRPWRMLEHFQLDGVNDTISQLPSLGVLVAAGGEVRDVQAVTKAVVHLNEVMFDPPRAHRLTELVRAWRHVQRLVAFTRDSSDAPEVVLGVGDEGAKLKDPGS